MKSQTSQAAFAPKGPVVAFSKPKNPSSIGAFEPKEKQYTYLTTQELADRMKYSVIAVRNELKDSVLIEGVHYFRPFGGRKLLFIWEVIEADMRKGGSQTAFGRF
jgi:hypothetical protein